MAFEKKVGMQGPFKIVVKAATPRMKDGTQVVGKKVHNGLLGWYVTCSEPADIGGTITVFAATQPQAGDTYEGAFLDGFEYPTGSGTIYLTMHSAADRAKPSDGGKGNAPAPRDYTYEGRMRAVDAVIAHAGGKGDMNFICTKALELVEFYKNGTIPPKTPAQA